MNYRKFGETAVAEVGLGTWQLGSADWGMVDDQDAFKVLKAYIDHGGNFIDTADVYGMGISESVIGRFLKTIHRPVFIASKLGRRNDHGNGWPQNFTYDLMKKHVEDSLKHLDIPQLFLEQLHCIPAEQMRQGKVFDHLRKLKSQGLIHHWGASVETTAEALACLDEEGISSLQVIFNLFRQHVADELFEKASRKKVAIIVRVPLASGLLTGRFTENTIFPEKDHRSYNADGKAFNVGETFSGIEFLEGVGLARKMSKLLPDERMSQWALRWILDHPAVTTVIPGASKVSQVEKNVEASALPPLSTETHQVLRNLYDEQVLPAIRGSY